MSDLNKDMADKLPVVKSDIKVLRKKMIHELIIDLYGDLERIDINEDLDFESKKKLSDRYDLLCRLMKSEGYT